MTAARTRTVPQPVLRAAHAMTGFPSPWALCGGWAVDAWLGHQTREHLDVDISIFYDAQPLILGHFTPDGWSLNGHDAADEDSTEQWSGRPLSHPAHVHARSADGIHLDIQLNRRDGSDWIFSARPSIRRPIDECVQETAWDVPALVPEVLLFYKAIGSSLREHDTADFHALRPVLSDPGREWLTWAVTALSRPSTRGCRCSGPAEHHSVAPAKRRRRSRAEVTGAYDRDGEPSVPR